MKIFSFIVVLFTGAFLLLATDDFPTWGDPAAPAHNTMSSYYAENTLDQTAVPNVVSAVLADYRGFDTMLETIVVFCVGIAVILLLRVPVPAGSGSRSRLPFLNRIRSVRQRPQAVIKPVERDLIIRTTTRLLFPPTLLFAFYVVVHGHYSPGGGFQGGVILGAAFIMLAISFNLKFLLERLSARAQVIQPTIGVAIYTLTGFACLLVGQNFLDYGALAPLFGMTAPAARSFFIFVIEVGVALTCMAVMVSIYVDLSSSGQLDEGL